MFQRYYSMPLKATFLIAFGMVLGGLQGAQAQDRLYRCDNNYYTSMAMVIGPTPPGTGVMARTWARASA